MPWAGFRRSRPWDKDLHASNLIRKCSQEPPVRCRAGEGRKSGKDALRQFRSVLQGNSGGELFLWAVPTWSQGAVHYTHAFASAEREAFCAQFLLAEQQFPQFRSSSLKENCKCTLNLRGTSRNGAKASGMALMPSPSSCMCECWVNVFSAKLSIWSCFLSDAQGFPVLNGFLKEQWDDGWSGLGAALACGGHSVTICSSGCLYQRWINSWKQWEMAKRRIWQSS